MSTATETEQIQQTLELGCYMGPGERYLMLYGGILTITSRTGLVHWPGGNRWTIAILDAADCVQGLTRGQYDAITERLRRTRGAVGTKADDRRDGRADHIPNAHPP